MVDIEIQSSQLDLSRQLDLSSLPLEEAPDTSSPEVPGFKRFGVVLIDLGSTAAKIPALVVSPHYDANRKYLGQRLRTVDDNESNWVDWSDKTEVLTVPGLPSCKCIRGENLENTLDMIATNVRGQVQLLEDWSLSPIALGITGFGNSLVIEWENHEGARERAVFLDNPSLRSTEFTEHQQEILKSFDVDPDPKKLGIRLIMKLLTLKNHPEVVEALCGEGVGFEDLRLSSVPGLIADRLQERRSDDRSLVGVSLDDLRGLGKDEFGKDPAAARAMLTALGISDTQLRIDAYDLFSAIKHIGHRENDWIDEARLIGVLRGQGAVDPRAVVLALDSVGKMVHPTFPSWKRSAASGERYATQRITGNMNGLWFRHLFHREDGGTDYGALYHRVGELLHMHNTYDFYFDPDDMSGPNEQGTLRHWDGEEWSIVQATDISNLSEDDQNQAMLAIVTGTFFGLRDKIEKAVPEGDTFPPIVIYGGLCSSNGWENVFSKFIAQSFSIPAVEYLPTMGAGLGAAYAVAQNFGKRVDSIAMNHEIIPAGDIDRTVEYETWQAQRAVFYNG